MKKTFSIHAVKGFTLLELICVIAVIALLLALLVPSLSRVKEISTRVVCGSNMKGFATVCTLYLNDSHNLFPSPTEWFYSAKSDTTAYPIGCRWHDWPMALHGELMNRSPEHRGMMWAYLSEMSQATCPDFRDYAVKRGCENPDHNPEIDIKPQFNYTMNAYLGSSIEGSVKSADKVYRPGAKFFFAEENSWSVRPDHPRYPSRWLNAPLSTKALDDTALLITPTPRAENCFGTFHGASRDLSNGNGNVAFIDGHVALVSVQEQLRKNMHGHALSTRSSLSRYEYHPAGNLLMAWPLEEPPPGGWDAQ